MPTALLDRPAPVVDDATRRQFLIGAAAFLMASRGGPALAAPGAPAADGFPVTIEHKYGSTVIPAEPERVVTIGYTDHDAVLALGVVPVGVGTDDDGYSTGQPFGIWPWAQRQLGDAAPQPLSYLELDLEAVAALRPDLVLGLTSGMTEREYGLLTRIAPTVAQPADYPDFFMPWPEQTRSAGRALGRAEQAERLVAGVDERFAAARREHPEFEGLVAVYAYPSETGYFVESSNSPRVSILTALGFTTPPEFDDLAGELTYAEISEEQLHLLDRDVLIWGIGGTPGERSTIEADPLYQQLVVARDHRDVFLEERVLDAALVLVSVLSVPYVIDQLVPKLAAAVDGNPATDVPA